MSSFYIDLIFIRAIMSMPREKWHLYQVKELKSYI